MFHIFCLFLQGVESLKISKKILLTGTPLQNDMEEFFALVEFSNPGVLGRDKENFRKRFVEPITAAREQSASQDIIDYGCQMSLVLQRLTQSFILRRTEIVNTRYLPPKGLFLIIFINLSVIFRRISHFLFCHKNATAAL